jgi:hypothetical protein
MQLVERAGIEARQGDADVAESFQLFSLLLMLVTIRPTTP